MKQTKTMLLCLLLAALMLLSSLTACGKDKEKDSNLIQLGTMSCSTRARASWKIRTEVTQSF